ncbi:tailspike protein [Alteromonas phage ZP6]|uniref:Right handed beta helix domain-containing protein n=1 Tax=Alteromonas phage ZP6 TaxID=2492447 RepID=A0A3S9U8B6_9CAUD|nr:tail protein [Alteromonas phage ZP6]AZS06567.1 tailspike protein [Alteromonas phage ZP6]
MTIQNTSVESNHVGNGSTTVFAYGFKAYDEAHIKVEIDGVVQSTSSYSASGIGNDSGGSVTLNAAPASGAEIRIYRDTPRVQQTDYQTYGRFPSETHERRLDYLTAMIQEIFDDMLSSSGKNGRKWRKDQDANGYDLLNAGTIYGEVGDFDQLIIEGEDIFTYIDKESISRVSETPPEGVTREGTRWYKPSAATTYVWYYDESGDGFWVEEPVAAVDQAIDGTISFESTQDMVDGVFAITGQLAFNRERGNAPYALAPLGYVAQVGDVVAADGRVWALQLSGGALVEWFGAKGNDVDNDTSAFQDAASRSQKLILFPNKTYRVEGLDLSGKRVDGNGATLKLVSGSSSRYIVGNFTASVLYLKDLTADASEGVLGNYAVQIGSGGLNAKGCVFTGAQNISGFGDGVVIASSNLESRILDCFFTNNGGAGLSVQETPRMLVGNSTATGNGQTGFQFNNYDQTLTKKIRNVVVYGCTSDSNSNGFTFGNPYNDNDFTGDDFGWSNGVARNIIVDSCIATNNTTYGFALSMQVGGASNCVARENVFGGMLVNGDEIAINNCTITRNQTYGIDIGHGRNITMTGGEVSFNSTVGGSALLLEACTSVTVVGTLVFSNGTGSNAQIVINAVGGTGDGRYFPTRAGTLHLKCFVRVAASEIGMAVKDNPTNVIDENVYEGPTSATFTRVQAKAPNYVCRYNGRHSNSFTPTVSGNIAVFPDIANNLVLNTTDSLNSIEPYSYNYFKGKISYIEVSNGGSGYTVGGTTMTITGDGTGATLIPIINNGTIIGARVSDFGSGYTTASVTITGDGTGAAATATIGTPLFSGKEIGLSHNQAQTLVRAGAIVLNNPTNSDLNAPAAGYTTLIERFGQWLLKAKTY